MIIFFIPFVSGSVFFFYSFPKRMIKNKKKYQNVDVVNSKNVKSQHKHNIMLYIDDMYVLYCWCSEHEIFVLSAT
jgi:hypothetical protein